MDIEAIKADIKSRTKDAILKTQEDVDEVFDRHIERFYAGYKPSSYKRTNQLKTTPTKSPVRTNGLGAEGDVYLDSGKLHYLKNIEIMNEEDGSIRISLNEWDADTVLSHAAYGSHGGFKGDGSSVWRGPVAELNGTAKALIIKNL